MENAEDKETGKIDNHKRIKEIRQNKQPVMEANKNQSMDNLPYKSRYRRQRLPTRYKDFEHCF